MTTAAKERLTPVIDPDFSRRHPLRVLVAEDNKVNARVIGLILRKLGYSHEIAANGALALEATREKSFDLIFMDLQMPVMDGLEATRRILAEAPEPSPRIVALTANVHPTDHENCMRVGMHGFIAKPADPARIAAALQRAHSEISGVRASEDPALSS